MIQPQTELHVASVPPKRQRGPWPWLIGLLVLAIAAGIGYKATHKAAGGEEGRRGGAGREKPSVPVLAATVERKAVPLELAAVGTVQPYASVAVRALAGGQLTRVAFAQGQPVRKGQLLFEIDPAPARAALAQAEAQLARDSVQANQARQESARYGQLARQGFVAREQAEQLRATAGAQDATVAADRAAVENARIQLAYTRIVSPIDGQAGALLLHAGNLVRANDTNPLVVINQVKPIYVDFALPEADIGRVRARLGQKNAKLPVTARAQGDNAVATGSLAFLDNAVDATTGTLHMKATFANQDGNLVPGQFVDVKLRLANEADQLVVPSSAVLTGQAGTYTYVIGADDAVKVRPVEVLRQAGSQTVLKRGVEPGERVVTDGQLQLTDGTKVKLRENLQPPPAEKGEGKRNGKRGGGHA